MYLLLLGANVRRINDPTCCIPLLICQKISKFFVGFFFCPFLSLEQRWKVDQGGINGTEGVHSQGGGEAPEIDGTNENPGQLEQCVAGKFHFVDLAGSERASKTGNRGERFKGSLVFKPYSRKYWRELNLAVWPKIAIGKILADLNLAARYRIATHIYACTKFCNMDCQT